MLGQASPGLHLQDGTQTGLTASEDHFWKIPEGPEVGRKELAQPLAMTKGVCRMPPSPTLLASSCTQQGDGLEPVRIWTPSPGFLLRS